MCEWHVPPDYIVANWTDEIMALMLDKLVERRRREAEAIERIRHGENTEQPTGDGLVSETEFLQAMGDKIKVIRDVD